MTLNKSLLALAAGLALTACGPQTPAEREADKARMAEWKAQQAALEATFPERLVVCDIETGKAYEADRMSFGDSGANYFLNEFPGPHWKCPPFEKGDKVP